jgi:glucosamine--fructose-6-phosphate aminotransferase (isomerizing)
MAVEIAEQPAAIDRTLAELLLRRSQARPDRHRRPRTRHVLVAGPEGPTLPGLIDLARIVRGKGSPVLGFGGDEEFRAACDLAVAGPELSEKLAPLALPIPAQLMVERLARELGLDPDAPRGLRKVTQTD